MTAATITRPTTRKVAKPAVSKTPASSVERDFIKGRDSAIGCLEEAQHFHDAQSEEPNRMRWIRKGKPQDNFVHGWIADAAGETRLYKTMRSAASARCSRTTSPTRLGRCIHTPTGSPTPSTWAAKLVPMAPRPCRLSFKTILATATR